MAEPLPHPACSFCSGKLKKLWTIHSERVRGESCDRLTFPEPRVGQLVDGLPILSVRKARRSQHWERWLGQFKNAGTSAAPFC
mgnify:FL=1